MNKSALAFPGSEARPAIGTPESRGLRRDEVRLMVTGAHGHEHARFRDLPRFLEPGTVLVVNASGTIPASLPAHGRLGAFVANLSTHYGRDVWLVEPRWTSERPGPLPLEVGEVVHVAGVSARLVATYPGIPRLWFARFFGDVHGAVARRGAPIRYDYLEPPYPSIGDYQTIFATIPGSAEMPSAARPFTPGVVEGLTRRGVSVAEVVLHAGVSSLEVESDEVEDHVLYPEPFEVSATTAAEVNAARAHRRPVIAVGTTVVRALESAWDGGGNRLREARGFTRVFVRPGRPVASVDGLITGLHHPFASHLAMLHAIADPELVRDSYAAAMREGYLWHEFGDSQLLRRA